MYFDAPWVRASQPPLFDILFSFFASHENFSSLLNATAHPPKKNRPQTLALSRCAVQKGAEERKVEVEMLCERRGKHALGRIYRYFFLPLHSFFHCCVYSTRLLMIFKRNSRWYKYKYITTQHEWMNSGNSLLPPHTRWGGFFSIARNNNTKLRREC